MRINPLLELNITDQKAPDLLFSQSHSQIGTTHRFFARIPLRLFRFRLPITEPLDYDWGSENGSVSETTRLQKRMYIFEDDLFVRSDFRQRRCIGFRK